jgi:hypothetical protein
MTTDLLVPNEEELLTLNARSFAIAWLNAFLATSDDESRAVLYRSLSLEWFDDGLHMVATSGHALFRSWVADQESGPWPAPKLKPNHSVVVMDVEGFGAAFMKTLLRVTNEEGREHEVISISVAKADEGATLSLGPEFVSYRVILRSCGQRIDLRVYDGEFPKWRQFKFGIDKRELVDGMTVSPKMFALLGKLRDVTAIDLEFAGETNAISFVGRRFEGAPPTVLGLVMPMRRPTPEDD